jgi:hypothetical protein
MVRGSPSRRVCCPGADAAGARVRLFETGPPGGRVACANGPRPVEQDPYARGRVFAHRRERRVPIAQLVLAIAEPGTSRLVGLVSEVNYHLKDAGVDHVFFTTQIANRPAIRVGEHLGYRLGRAEYVFRRLL